MRILRPLACLALATLSVFLTSCGKRGTAVEAGNRDQVLHIGNLAEPADLDPHVITSQQDGNIVMALFEGLVQYDPKTAEPVPAVAERWETSADNLTWTFHLRKSAKWSNGDPVTAHDFVFAYRRMVNPKLAAEYASLLYVLKNAQGINGGKITDITQLGARASDDNTLVLTLENPAPYLLSMLCHTTWYPLHRPTLEKFKAVETRGTAWTRPGNFVGNGYFTLEEWRQHQLIRLKKNPTYWDAAEVKLNAVIFYPIESEDAEERAFRSGQLHTTVTMPISKISVYRDEKSPFYQPHIMLGTFFLRFNTEKPPLNDARVRRALSLAIDREKFVKEVLRGGQVAATHFTPPGTAGFTANSNFRYDLETARKLLAEAGYPEGKGMPKFDYLYNTTEANRVIAEALQQMWRTGLGVDMTPNNQEARVYTTTMRAGDYQVGRYAWIGDYLDASTFLELMTSTSGNNMTRWKNAEYDRLFAESASTANNKRRHEIFQRLEQIIAEEAPIAPIYFYVRNTLRRPEIKGWYGNLLDKHALKGVYLDASAAVK